MANYSKYSDVDFARFEPKPSAYSQNAAHKIVEMPPFEGQNPQKPKMELVRRKKKSVRQAREEMRENAFRATAILCISLVFLGMFAWLLYSRLRVDELTREVDTATAELSLAQAETVRLNAALDSMISLEKVENYAKNDLGMTKVEGYQIEYIDLSGADSVSVSGQKSVKPTGETTLTEKLLEYLKAE